MFGWWSWRIILTNILGIVAIRGIPINQPVWSFPPDMLPKPDCWAVGSGSSVVPGHNTMSHLKRKWTTTPRWRARKPHLEYNPWVAMFWVSQHLSIKKKTGSGSRLLYIFEHETSRNSWYSWMSDEIWYLVSTYPKLSKILPFFEILKSRGIGLVQSDGCYIHWQERMNRINLSVESKIDCQFP